MNTISKHLIISGRVQGVGFRYFTYRNANELRLKGWVKNLRDGTVETVLTGDAENVYEMVEKLKEGPASARVDNIENVDGSVDSESFNDFTIKR
ncbi:acylphosphatase [Rhodohalobacter sulfatireducens]|uniref:Acylphosphatase n=1 Tax=Rhodohalobacter sulfatireducens TaxID=2911366 RepID=A0ABS9KAH3_9BACT|nr:acylphosphatase [Rhodohalobacter sulfatireducens]MCG2587851.1 acylphosphatase [Rhodohalobacter sulfatireducens]